MPLSEKEEFELLSLEREKSMAAGDKAGQIPGAPSARPAAAAAPSLSEKIVGAGEAGVSALTAATGGVLGYAGGALGGIAGEISSGEYGTPQGTEKARQSAEAGAEKLTYAPRTPTGKEYLGKAGDIASATKLAGLNPTQAIELAAASRPAAAAARQELGKVGPAIAASPEADLLKRGAGAVKQAVTPKIDPEVAALARKAQELGIDIRPDQLTNNRILKMMGEALEKVPLSGSKVEQRQEAFNRTLMSLIGSESKDHKLTPDVFDKAMTKSGSTIGEISAKHHIPYTGEFKAELEQILANSRFETSDVAKILRSYGDEIMEQGAADKWAGVIDGETFRKIRTKVSTQMRTTDNGDLKHALSQLDDVMLDAMKGQLSKEEIAAFDLARKQYAIGKTIEPLVAKSNTGDITPGALMQAVTFDKSKKTAMARGRGGELGDLARVAQLFIKEPPSSGTAERIMSYGLLTGGSFIEPHTAAGIVGAANLYNRLGPKLSRKLTGASQQAANQAGIGGTP